MFLPKIHEIFTLIDIFVNEALKKILRPTGINWRTEGIMTEKRRDLCRSSVNVWIGNSRRWQWTGKILGGRPLGIFVLTSGRWQSNITIILEK